MGLTALLAFGLDRLSKIIVIHWLNLNSVHVIAVWPPYLNFVMAWNPGVNFGLLGKYGWRWILVAFSIAVSSALAVWVRNKRGWMLPLAAGMLVGGALSNAYDRVVFGAVADYLNMSCCGINNPYSFNVADIFVVSGTALIVLVLRFEE
jgi:signal peptidase II